MPAWTVEYLWTFDDTYQDLSGTFNTIPENSPNFNSMSITGYGSSLSLSIAQGQYLRVSNPQLKLYNQSWTFEAWIYPTNVSGTNDYAIVAQCRSVVPHTCLHLVIRNQKLYFGLYGDDVPGNTVLTTSKWYHVAFAFDCATRAQSVYLNGRVDGSGLAAMCFQGYNQSLTIGITEVAGAASCFAGLIDQLSFTNRTKTAVEILQDATLTVHVPFDDNSTNDQGPLRINGSLIGNVTYIPGRFGQAIEIKTSSHSNFEVHGLVLLGINNLPYSFAIWIRPYILQQSTIMHLANEAAGNGWCVAPLGLTSTGQLMAYTYSGTPVSVLGPVVPANSWTHAVVTYSDTNGLRLYVNGTLNVSSGPCYFSSGQQPMHLFVGSPLPTINCVSGYNNSGAVDEFRVYSRELNGSDIFPLAHP